MSARSRRRMFQLGAAAIIAIWLLGRGIPSLVGSIREFYWTLSDRVGLLERSRVEVASRKGLEDSASVFKERLLGQAPRILGGTGAAEAEDALVGLVNVATTRANAKVTRTEPIADSTTQGLLRSVRILVAFDADANGTMTVLRDLAEANPSLLVESLSLLVADPAVPAGSAEVLRIELVVRGWYLEEEGS